MSEQLLEKYCTSKQAAKKLNVNRSTVNRLIKQGRLPATKYLGQWFIDRVELEQFASNYVGKVGKDFQPPLYRMGK